LRLGGILAGRGALRRVEVGFIISYARRVYEYGW
jgi:hypothetical protein